MQTLARTRVLGRGGQPAGGTGGSAYTINRLDVPTSLHRCLATTNVIESPHAGVRMRTNRVSRWKDGKMVQRWVASSFLATEKSFRRIMGYKDLWALKAILDEKVEKDVAPKQKVA